MTVGEDFQPFEMWNMTESADNGMYMDVLDMQGDIKAITLPD